MRKVIYENKIVKLINDNGQVYRSYDCTGKDDQSSFEFYMSVKEIIEDSDRHLAEIMQRIDNGVHLEDNRN